MLIWKQDLAQQSLCTLKSVHSLKYRLKWQAIANNKIIHLSAIFNFNLKQYKHLAGKVEQVAFPSCF